MKKVLALISFITLLNPADAIACGACVNAHIQVFFPFFIFWFLLFLVWLLISFLICVIAKISGQEIDFVHAKRPGLALLIRCVIFAGLFILGLGSILFPTMVFIVPLWFRGIYKRIKEAKAIPNRGLILNIHYYFNWLTVVLIIVLFVYAYVDIKSTSQIFGARSYLAAKARSEMTYRKKMKQGLPEMSAQQLIDHFSEFEKNNPPTITRKHTDGAIISETYADGDLSHTKEYHESGALKGDWYYMYGELAGIGKRYYESGQLRSEGPYKNGLLDGHFKEYHENGNMKSEWHYVQGKLEGMGYKYYEEGSVKVEWPMNNDKSHGLLKTYYKDGTLKGESTYNNGLYDGKVILYQPDGSVLLEETYIKNVMVNKKWGEGADRSMLEEWDKEN